MIGGMSDNDSKSPRQWHFPFVALPVTLLLYALSAGPLTWLYARGWLGSYDGFVVQTLRVFYTPLIWLMADENGQPYKFVEIYFECWQ